MDTPGFRDIVDSETRAAYRDAGWWVDRMLVDHVHDHARCAPDASAYITPTGRLSWAAYDTESDRLAGALVATGAPAGGRVAVLLPDDAAVHVAYLAAEKAGLTIVGLGTRAGDRELTSLLQRTGANILITHDALASRSAAELVSLLRDSGCAIAHHVVVPAFEDAGATRHITVDGDATDAPPLDVGTAEERRTRPDDLWLINSTSGTTGLPKCVVHTQNRWWYFHTQAAANAGLEPGDVFLSALPAPFGFGIWTSHTTPTYLGAPTVLPGRFNADTVIQLIERERVTVLSCVSTQFIMMLNADALAHHDLSSLRVMFTGGEAVPYERAVAFERQTGATVLQFYGSNETGLLSGTTLGDPPKRRLRTAGHIVPEMHVRLFDDGLDVTDTGRGQPGCRGPATSVGYLDDPGANAQLFTDDGWMLMGDICTLDADGCLSVVGRTSDIIIRGGKNISAAQVEAEVQSHPAVALAAALALPDAVVGERVCCYVQLRPTRRLTLDELSEFLVNAGVGKELLPEALVIVDALPVSSGGKIAKGELRTDLARRVERGDLVAR